MRRLVPGAPHPVRLPHHRITSGPLRIAAIPYASSRRLTSSGPTPRQGHRRAGHLPRFRITNGPVVVDPAATNHPVSVCSDAEHAFVVPAAEHTVYAGTSSEHTPFVEVFSVTD